MDLDSRDILSEESSPVVNNVTRKKKTPNKRKRNELFCTSFTSKLDIDKVEEKSLSEFCFLVTDE